jgi:23S rRNA pseudouridine1911/1915/1917 synthase
MKKEIKYTENTRKRIDEFLVGLNDIPSRSFAQKLVKENSVFVNGISVLKPSFLLTKDDIIEFEIKLERLPENIVPSEVPFEIIFEDENILIINKPAGVVVHPGAGNREGTLVSGLLNYWGSVPKGLDPERPGIVHRLDKDTSGLMLIAKNPKSLFYYSSLFKDRKIDKRYITLLYGKIPLLEGIISGNISRSRLERKKMTMTEDDSGRYSETHYKVVDYYVDKEDSNKKYTLLEAKLKTGRTHQIRVHMKYLGYPIVGDSLYAGKKMRNLYSSCDRQLLHAYKLKFIDENGVIRNFKIDIPADFKEYLSNLKVLQ